MQISPDVASEAPRATRAAQRRKTNARILQAVLDIIVESGMRGVRHRAVAKRAGVSLGSTTYHFSNIEDLIISAFHFWRAPKVKSDSPFYRDIVAAIEPCRDGVVPASKRAEIAALICEQSIRYVCSQVTGSRRDRVIELAFYHESIREPSLRKLLAKVRQMELKYLEWVHGKMGSASPEEDARITMTLFRQLEQSAVMAVIPELDVETTRRTLTRHMELCFGVPLSSGEGPADES